MKDPRKELDVGMRGSHSIAVAAATALVMLVAPASASALRYASTTGSSANDCSAPDAAHACDLETAIEGDGGTNVPSTGEEVVIEPGSYSLTTFTQDMGKALNIHGVSDQPRPLITMTGIGHLEFTNSTVSYLDIETPGSNNVNMSGGVMERVFMRGASLSGGPTCQCYGGIQRDSVFITTTASPAIGVNSNGAVSTDQMRNITAVSTNAGGPAIGLTQASLGSLTYDAYNVIARNLAGGTDVAATGPGSTVTFHHSNYGSASASGGSVIQDAPSDPHQTAAPLFTNAGTSDFSEMPGSPTIDAGLNDPLNGGADFAGNPRTLGAATDIGAFEFVPPSPAPPPTNPTALPPAPTSSAPVTKKCKGKRHHRSAVTAKKCKKKRR